MILKICNKSNNPLPKLATKGSAGMDIRAFLEEPLSIKPMERVIIPTGLYLQFPVGVVMLLTPRSGLALKKGITLVNAPATIDSDYRGELGVILINLSKGQVVINNGDRICQAIFINYQQNITIESVGDEKDLSSTDRAGGGFGSTGDN